MHKRTQRTFDEHPPLPPPRGRLHSHIIEPIKEMSLISGGVLALVNHRGFLAGAGDMQGALRHLYGNCLITPL